MTNDSPGAPTDLAAECTEITLEVLDIGAADQRRRKRVVDTVEILDSLRRRQPVTPGESIS